MSQRYDPNPPGYRPRDRTRSPPRYADRRASAANIFDNRPSGPARSASDAPRGPRYDGPRPLPPGGPGAGIGGRPPYLREQAPLGSGDRGGRFRERDYDRRDRMPSPRDRSPPRGFLKDAREYPPRELEVPRQRRGSRDGPLPPPSTYPDASPLPTRGSYRGRGRGDFASRGRGGRSNFDDRELIWRPERSPPRTWSRDLLRDSRDADRRDDRRFDSREDDRRPADWPERDREREFDRVRRDPLPPARLEARNSNDSINSTTTASQAPRINPDRLALIEGSGADAFTRRPSVAQDVPPPREQKRELLDTPAYLNGRAATTTSRYGARGSSSPTQAPPVPAFTFSTSAPAPPRQPSQAPQAAQPVPEAKRISPMPTMPSDDFRRSREEARPPSDAPTAPRAPPPAPKAQMANAPPAAPRGPRAQEIENFHGPRLHQVRSLEGLPTQQQTSHAVRNVSSQQSSTTLTPGMPTLNQPVSPNIAQPPRFGEMNAPTGPRTSRASPAQASISPRPPFASPKSDMGGQQSASSIARASTPPPSAPTGPRSRPYTVSPKVAPTAPTAFRSFNRGPPLAPRGPERGPPPAPRGPETVNNPQLGPQTAPRGPPWNQWKRPGIPAYNDKTIPAKRDAFGEEKVKAENQLRGETAAPGIAAATSEEGKPRVPLMSRPDRRPSADRMEIDSAPLKRQTSLPGHSAAQSFFGKPVESVEDDTNDTGMSGTEQEVPSTSEDEESDFDEDMTLFHAKFERQKRQLEAKMVDLSQPPYRAMSPLETISRLVRISMRDVEKYKEERERDMDVDESPMIPERQMPRTSRSSDSADGPDVLTPKGEEDNHVAIHDTEESSETVRRIRRPSPQPVVLPYLLKDGIKSFHESATFDDHVKRHEDTDEHVLDAMQEDVQADEKIHAEAMDAFAVEFRRWREECEELDRIKEELEKLERQQSIEPGPNVDAPMAPPAVPFEVSRRSHKFNSEYEYEQVLKQSEETARIEQERQEREAKKNQADMEKEAKIPSQFTEDEIRRAIFVDTNRYRDPDNLTAVFTYLPPADNFTEEEQHIFIAAFKDTPKKWGEIASLLPGRTYEECIRHYYANKWDGRFRDNRTKKLKAGGRRGRGGARGPRGRMGGLMADLARNEDILSLEAMSEKGRPRRAAAPTTFGEKEVESKAALLGQSPAKKLGANGKPDASGDGVADKPGVKRQKRTGDKPGRKAKGAQPLAALAAAPQGQGSPAARPYMPRDEQARLEEASLLTGLHAGWSHEPQGMAGADQQMMFGHSGFMQPMGGPDDDRVRSSGGTAPAAKQSASSYWSVPEQNDFVKYIGHFGRDFAAIAAHMGTKTQTMIKNHYQRQIESGGKPELERSAIEAEQRRARGDEIGPAPIPTPISKRKYESVPSSTHRPLAPHGDAMDVDETGVTSRVPISKHASPSQYQPLPRTTASVHNTPIVAPRRVPSPVLTTTAPPQSQPPAPAHIRQMQHPLGTRLTFMPDARPESRQAQQPVFGIRPAEEAVTRPHPQQPNRAMADAHDPVFISSLYQEQQRAIRIQGQQAQPERAEQLQRQNPMLRMPSQGSPHVQPLQPQPERRPVVEERAPTPPRPGFLSSAIPRTSLGSAPFGIVPSPFSSIPGRSAFNHSPPNPTKREEQRPMHLSSVPPAVPPPAPAPPSEPKRSNVMSLLNDDEPPAATKREDPPVRTSSPAGHAHAQSGPTPPGSVLPSMRREPSFGQPSLPGSHFGRSSFGQPVSAPATGPPTPKHEHGFGSGGSIPPVPKSDWTTRILGQNESQRQSSSILERDSRQFYAHQPHRTSLLGSLGQQRAIPSPPPLGGLAHSRTPSLSGQPPPQPREQAQPGLVAQQEAGQVRPNPFGSQSLPSFSQPPSSQVQNHAHHSHNGSIGGPFPSLHHRGVSRDEQYAREELRAREEHEARRWHQEMQESPRWGEEERLAREQQLRQQDQERQQSLFQQRPQPLQPPPFSAYPPNSLRKQSQMEVESAMRAEEERRQRQRLLDEEAMMRQQMMLREGEYQRRQRMDGEERARREEMFRRTPLGGGFGGPSQGQQPPGSGRR